LLTFDELSETLLAIRQINPECALLDEDSDQLDGLTILAVAETARPAMAPVDGELADDHDGHDDVDDHDHDDADADDHDHDGHQHPSSEALDSLAHFPDKDYSTSAIEALFTALSTGTYGRIYRAKGFVRDGTGGFNHLEYVYGHGKYYKSSYQGESKLVVIGEDLDKPGLIHIIEAE
jgi:G3E family GTPase